MGLQPQTIHFDVVLCGPVRQCVHHVDCTLGVGCSPQRVWVCKRWTPLLHFLPSRKYVWYRANSKVSRNPNFCVGCFELIISKNFAAASKMGKNWQKKIFLVIFFCGTHFCIGCWTKNYFFCGFFFCVLGIGVDSFCCYCKKACIPWTLGLQSIAQISTNKHGSGRPVFQQTSSKLVHNS